MTYEELVRLAFEAREKAYAPYSNWKVGDAQEGSKGYCAPCGVCRQVMSEFCSPDEFEVICGKSETEYKVFTLRQMIPECNFVVENDGYGFKGN